MKFKFVNIPLKTYNKTIEENFQINMQTKAK